ncbi:MAG: type II secretion system F family protein [Candidatus Aenigmatarchaeota archaeon]|nr:type II secretion system F family protein [Candidatus Aenigmarchaeota archaeon]
MRIPFLPMKPETILKISKKSFIFILADKISKILPLEITLKQADISYDEREWLSLAIYSSIHWFLILFSILFFIGIISKTNIFSISLVLSLVFSSFVFIYFILFPSFLVSRKVRDVEKNLPHVLRHLLIELRGGVSLYNALLSISSQDYGILSKEFKEAVKKISSGYSEIQVLEELALKIPSQKFRKVMWQIINSLRSGVEISDVLKDIVNNIVNEQRAEIREYASSLNPIALSFMMFCIIFPTMGLIVILLLTSFIGIKIPKEFLYIILALIAFVQFNFIGIIKSKRPWV